MDLHVLREFPTVIVAARPEEVQPDEVVPPDQVPVGLFIPEGYVARRILPFSRVPSILTRRIR
jgi:hypothetical protein